MADYLTYSEIKAAIQRAIKDYDASLAALVGEVANMVYMNEIMVCDGLHPLYWLRKYIDSWRAIEPATITGITAATPPVVTAANSFSDDDIVSIHNVAGMVEVNDRFFIVDDQTAANFSLDDIYQADIVGAGYTAYTSGGTAHHRGFVISSTLSPQRILSLYFADEGALEPIVLEELNLSNSWTNDNTGRPKRYQLFKDYSSTGTERNLLIWYPGADDTYRALQCWYENRASKLVNDTDVPLLPPQFHWAIVAGAVTRLAENSVQVENAVIWPGIYTKMLDDLRVFNRKFYDEFGKTQRNDEGPYLL